MSNELQNFLSLPYEELEELNLKAKEQRKNRVDPGKIQEERLKYLTDEKRIKAVTVMFSDLEGRMHMLDYDKKFLVKSWDNLTFDGSSIRGFTAQRESDLRLGMDWGAFYWAPSDIFGSGKVLVFGEVIDKDGSPYGADIRGVLKAYANGLYKKEGYTLNAANEIEGFLFKGKDAERCYNETGKFEYVNTGGYYHSLPGDPLRTFIDKSAEVQRAMGFENEKDHPEVAPSQFEINYSYGEVVAAADQIQLYKLICRQVATTMGLTASFLPKPLGDDLAAAVCGDIEPEKESAGRTLVSVAVADDLVGEIELGGIEFASCRGDISHASRPMAAIPARTTSASPWFRTARPRRRRCIASSRY